MRRIDWRLIWRRYVLKYQKISLVKLINHEEALNVKSVWIKQSTSIIIKWNIYLFIILQGSQWDDAQEVRSKLSEAEAKMEQEITQLRASLKQVSS